MSRWEFWIDRGGTFTDVVARSPDGRILSRKLLSDNPEQYPDAAVEGIRRMLDLTPDEPIPVDQIECVKMGTTVATNALLERKGERVALVINRGFADVLRIGTQQRPRLFDLEIRLPEQVPEQVLEVDGRMSVEGEELESLDLAAARESLAKLEGIQAIAIVCMHGYRYPRHENAIAEIARELGFTQVSTSHETSRLIKLVNRGDTTVVDAYLSPVLRRYVEQVRTALPAVHLLFMQSNGGLTDATLFQGRNSILSGPAGGVVGAAKVGIQAGFERVIGFDMGGTSTDVTHFAGEFERRFETEVAGVRICAPMMHIHTVAAGGGSICRFDGTRLRVGPDSAGANPGPACYRRGGPLTVTDCNVMLGRLRPEFFPKIFGPKGDLPFDRDLVIERFGDLASEVGEKSAEEIASGFLRIAVDKMANAIKRISVARGYDVTRYTLVTFGGAGGQHACDVADSLGIEKVLIHPLAGVLSAYGIGLAEIRALRECSVEKALDRNGIAEAEQVLNRLEVEARDELASQRVTAETVLRRLHIRYSGTDTPLPMNAGSIDKVADAFQKAHRGLFGYAMDTGERGLVIDAVSVEAVSGPEERTDRLARAIPAQQALPYRDEDKPATARAKLAEPSALAQQLTRPVPVAEVEAVFAGAWKTVLVFDRERLAPGDRVDGPAIIIEGTTTTIVDHSWGAEITPRLDLVLTRSVPRPSWNAAGTSVDPVLLEVFNNLFMSIAEQMGSVLQNAAYSVNIKERLDFSCALFDEAGRLVANAPHVPVHLGSMGEAVRAVISRRTGRVQLGDVYALNDPFAGGTHLPDITVVTPFFGSANEPIFWVANRGHHADVGGVTPGSMPPNSHTIDEEGVLITDFLLVEGGRFREDTFLEVLRSAKYPARNPAQNIGDIRAQIAANEKGLKELRAAVDQFGLDVVQAYMRHVRANAAELVRRVIDHLKPGQFIQKMDSGAEIHVRIDVDTKARRARIDFEGTSAQTKDSFNAPSSIVHAAVLYVFRTLIREDIPLNDGCLEAIDIKIPEGSMLAPRPPAAVAAGNVETSQAIANALYGALGVLAASQGTMNNLTFGNDRHQYYETICGGAGAGNGFCGASAVHTHMTNTRLTDAEVLEQRYPVVVEKFAIRSGSGGKGRWRGGDGVIRQIRFRERMNVAILANHRAIQPFGLDGGGSGKTGRTFVQRVDGRIDDLGSCGQTEVAPGDSIVIETPGGGGWGTPTSPGTPGTPTSEEA
jgi:5-oxoprolinase (ATP-hydrolysing)